MTGAAAGARRRADPLAAATFDDILERSDLIVELMGGLEPAREYVLRAMAAGQARRDRQQAAALPARRGAVGAARARTACSCASRRAVAGVVPVIRVLQETLAAAHVDRLHGIVNGTTNFILTRDGARPAPRTTTRSPRPSGSATPRPTRPRTSTARTRRPRWRSSRGWRSTRPCTSTTSATRGSSTSRARTWSTPASSGSGSSSSAPPSASTAASACACTRRSSTATTRSPRSRPVQRRHDRVAGDHRDHAVAARARAARRPRARCSAT